MQERRSRVSQCAQSMTNSIHSRDNDLRVSGKVAIPRDEIDLQASRSGGPGGQHVNTSSTRIEVRWNLDATRALTADEKSRARAKLGARVDADGTIRVTASESRSQRRNRDMAEARLAELIRAALVIPKPRRPTKPHRGAREARLRTKRERSDRKQARHWHSED
jgi:ribosome-associated protein